MDMTYYNEILTAAKREFARHRSLCALVFALVLIGVITAGLFWGKSYESDALIYIDSANILEPLLRGRAEVSDVDRAEQAQELMYTRSLLRTAATDAGMLDEDSEPRDVQSVINHLRRNIMVEAESTNYFRVSYRNSDPQRSFDVLNSLINTFIGNRAAAKQSESNNAYSFIDSQVQLYRAQLDEAEQKLKENKAESLDTTEAAVKERISNLTTEIQDLKISIQESESKIATTRRLLNEEGSHLNKQSELFMLKQRRQALRTELNELRLAYQESYPDIVSIKEQLKEVDADIAALGSVEDIDSSFSQTGEALFDDLRKQLSVAEVDVKSKKRRLQSLESLLQEEYQRADRVAENQARLAELYRDYDVIVDVYEELLSRKENAKLSMALNVKGGGENYKIVEPPVYPIKPSGPQFVHFAVAAPILGLGAPFGLILAFIMADPRIRSATTLVQSMPIDLELMGVVPHFRSPTEARADRAEITMLIIFCSIVAVGYGLLVYAGFAKIV